MNTPEESRDVVERFIGDAKQKMHTSMERTLREIAALPWWKRWRASDMASKCLGIYWYWDYAWNPDKNPDLRGKDVPHA